MPLAEDRLPPEVLSVFFGLVKWFASLIHCRSGVARVNAEIKAHLELSGVCRRAIFGDGTLSTDIPVDTARPGCVELFWSALDELGRCRRKGVYLKGWGKCEEDVKVDGGARSVPDPNVRWSTETCNTASFGMVVCGKIKTVSYLRSKALRSLGSVATGFSLERVKVMNRGVVRDLKPPAWLCDLLGSETD